MIEAAVALTFDRVKQCAEEHGREAPDESRLSDADRGLLDYLDATVESGIYKSFKGEIFDVKIPASFAPPEVVEALKRRYERPPAKPGDAAWLVGVFVSVDAKGDVVEYQIVFAPTLVPPREVVGELPPSPDKYLTREEVLALATLPPPRLRRGGPPRVLLVSDVPGWAFDANMHDLASYLADDFEFKHFYTEDWFKGARPNWSAFDVIYELFHRNPPMGIPLDRTLGALRSQFFKAEKPARPDEDDIRFVNGYRGFQVAAERNYIELRERCPRVVYLTNPIDTRRFVASPEPKSAIVVEWNGNAGHQSPNGRLIKHFYDVVVPACDIAKVQLVSAEYGVPEGPRRRRKPAEMPDFYRQANVAICASEYEAASNSVMEAMSSGLALVATDVGNHRELRDAQMKAFGDTGILLVDRDVGAFAEALRSLTPKRALEMGEVNRAEIAARWSWDLWRESYRVFLMMACR